MIPFRVYDRDKREMWIVLNYHSGDGAGNYLVAKEDENESDGEMKIITPQELAKLKLVDFLEEAEDY